MKTPRPPAPVVATLDLGDLSSLTVGSEVVTVFDEGPGTVRIGDVAIVAVIEPERIRVRRNGKTVDSYDPRSGRTRIHMYGPVFYLSANPAHIALAKEHAAAVWAIVAAEEAALQARLAVARPITEELAPDEPGDLANTLAARLDAAQLATLSGWLKLG